MLDELLKQTDQALDEVLLRQGARITTEEIGVVVFVGGDIARVKGLPSVQSQELIRFANGSMGIASDLDLDGVGVVLLGESEGIVAGTEVRRTGRVLDVAVGSALLGRVIDALGRPLDELGAIETVERYPVERDAPAILDRAPVTTPLETGIKVIDAIIPIGRGQRELILGDRQTGKTAIAVDTMIHQRDKGVICVYCSIGQRSSATAGVIEALKEYQALSHCVVVVAAGEDPAGLQFITPYAATTIAEYFMLQGHDVLIVYDDLTRHARAYRELSLLLRRPPGREAFPGDIFYIHSRLLERSTHLREELGDGSLTALPIIETEAQNLSAYIPTNLISITDGQIYLSPELFQKGVLPAVDIGKSVSRVGGRTQLPAYRKIAGALRLSYAQFEELETFARFGTRLDEASRQTIERGRHVRELLKQAEHEPLTFCEQIIVLLALNYGLFDGIPLEKLPASEQIARWAVGERLMEVCHRIHDGETLSEADIESILAIVTEALQQHRAPAAPEA
jgi:F-type H+-transporting ATPase subunit alpha